MKQRHYAETSCSKCQWCLIERREQTSFFKKGQVKKCWRIFCILSQKLFECVCKPRICWNFTFDEWKCCCFLMFWQLCRRGRVWFRKLKTHLGYVQEKIAVGLTWFCHHEHDWKMSQHLVKNVRRVHVYKTLKCRLHQSSRAWLRSLWTHVHVIWTWDDVHSKNVDMISYFVVCRNVKCKHCVLATGLCRDSVKRWINTLLVLVFSQDSFTPREKLTAALNLLNDVKGCYSVDFQEALTLRNLWALGCSVIVSYEHSIAGCHSDLWPHIPYWWANKCKAEALIEAFEHRKQHGRPGNSSLSPKQEQNWWFGLRQS